MENQTILVYEFFLSSGEDLLETPLPISSKNLLFFASLPPVSLHILVSPTLFFFFFISSAFTLPSLFTFLSFSVSFQHFRSSLLSSNFFSDAFTAFSLSIARVWRNNKCTKHLVAVPGTRGASLTNWKVNPAQWHNAKKMYLVSCPSATSWRFVLIILRTGRTQTMRSSSAHDN